MGVRGHSTSILKGLRYMQEALKTGAAATVTSLGSGLRASEIAPV